MSDFTSPQKKAWATRRARTLGTPVETPGFTGFMQIVEDTPAKAIKPSPAKENSARYTYNSDTDTYVTYLRNTDRLVTITGDNHRGMLSDYSNVIGKEHTAIEICDKYNFPKECFNEYKDVHGWTHDQLPVTKEQLNTNDTNSLVESIISQKKALVRQQFEKKSEKDLKIAADKWINYEQSVLSFVKDAVYNLQHRECKQIDLAETEESYAAVIAPMDLHYGRGSWRDETGESYSRAECRELLMFHTNKLVNRLVCHGRPDVIIVPLGSDWFHIDNNQGRTTAGTPQDLDGTPGLILKEGMELAVEHIDLLRQIAPVELVMCAGNHDEHSSIALMMFLYAWYRDCEDVNVQLSLKPRNYTTYGSTVLAFSHGDRTSPTQLAKLIPHEARELWANHPNTALFTGHLHYEMSREDTGVCTYQMPSLAGSDRWHNKSGYILSRRALSAYLIYEEDGPGGQIISPVANAKTFGFKTSGYRKKR